MSGAAGPSFDVMVLSYMGHASPSVIVMKPFSKAERAFGVELTLRGQCQLSPKFCPERPNAALLPWGRILAMVCRIRLCEYQSRSRRFRNNRFYISRPRVERNCL